MPRPAKRSFTIDSHRTSISLEEPFWVALKEIAKETGQPVAKIVQSIDQSRRSDDGLSSAIRVWILAYYRDRSAVASALPRPASGGHDLRTARAASEK